MQPKPPHALGGIHICIFHICKRLIINRLARDGLCKNKFGNVEIFS